MNSTSLTQKELSRFYAACILIHMARRLKAPLWKASSVTELGFCKEGHGAVLSDTGSRGVLSSGHPRARPAPHPGWLWQRAADVGTRGSNARSRAQAAFPPTCTVEHTYFLKKLLHTELFSLKNWFLLLFPQKLKLTREIRGWEYLCAWFHSAKRLTVVDLLEIMV